MAMIALLDCSVLVAAPVNPALYRTRPVLWDASVLTTRHIMDSGRCRIASIVDIKGTTNTPVARRVLLLESRSKRVIAETWSNGEGYYSFDCIAPGKYDVITYDHTGNYRAVIADGIDAEPMP